MFRGSSPGAGQSDSQGEVTRFRTASSPENTARRARLAELASQDPALTVPGTRTGTGIPDDPFMHATRAAVHSAVHHSVHAAVSAAATTSHHAGGSSAGGDSSPSHHHH
jgi:hypothetical protein